MTSWKWLEGRWTRSTKRTIECEGSSLPQESGEAAIDVGSVFHCVYPLWRVESGGRARAMTLYRTPTHTARHSDGRWWPDHPWYRVSGRDSPLEGVTTPAHGVCGVH